MVDLNYQLSDRYTKTEGRVFMTGIQALVRLPIMQSQLDRQSGLNTAGLISGYRGSPLGGYDQEIWRSQKHLNAHDVEFEPAINEDLGATILWGAQLIDYYREDAKRDGVFTYWYGKAHGLDRSADVLRQGNVQGTAKHGGLLAFVGDDHNAESSMFSHQTDQVLESAMMPILFPSSIDEFLTMGLAGMAMSRFSGLWCGMKTITETVESAASFDLPGLVPFKIPEIEIPKHGFNYDPYLNWPAERLEFERRMIEERVPAAHSFAYANKIDRVVFQSPRKRLGIVTTGKAHGDLMQALVMIGLDEVKMSEAGISIYKVGMSWPLEPRGIREFAEGMESIFVVEEKRPQLEKQIKEQLFNWPTGTRPGIVGKRDINDAILLPEIWFFTPEIVAKALARWLAGTSLEQQINEVISGLEVATHNRSDKLVVRTPYFCSGCPHNTSTKVPEGSSAGAGIGCHIMVLGQGRKSETFTHMGGEGMHWVGLNRYSEKDHMFQNLGDGTYQHSGSLAIRQAVVSGTNITYKILFNDAVAMVGGQPVEGAPSPGVIAQQVLAEGVKRVALVSDNIEHFRDDRSIPNKTERYDRDELDTVQKSMRETEGVTVIIYEQTCAAEKRRRRKKGSLEDPPKRMFINDRVCEGCGDCSVQSNCISIEPKETDFGRKRQINQSSCNKDFSCVKGFCPSFVSVLDGEIRKPDVSHIEALQQSLFSNLPLPVQPEIGREYSILVAGIGGMGVLTIGGILSMAAHIEGKGSTTLDFTGLSQKNGAVTAHIKVAPSPSDINVPRIADGMADLLLGCDMIAAAPSVNKIGRERTKSVINTEEVPVAAFTRNNEMYFPASETKSEFVLASSEDAVSFLSATKYAKRLFGDAIATNMFVVGYAYQKGFIPISENAILRAIELNGVAVQFNQRAFQWGRVAADNIDEVDSIVGIRSIREPMPSTLSELIEKFVSELTQYQNAAYADQFKQSIEQVQRHEERAFGTTELTKTAAKNLYKLMAYKDEYEVGRLYSSPEFEQKLSDQFAGNYKLKYHLAPPLISRMNKATGRPDKIAFGGWMKHGFKFLASLKGLRGTPFDVFGYSHERREERALIKEYQALLDEIMPTASISNWDRILRLLALPDGIRGYGPVKEANIKKVRAQWAKIASEATEPEKELA